MEHRQMRRTRQVPQKLFQGYKTRMNTAKKVGLYFILCSVFNSEVSFENLMLCATKFFGKIFRKGVRYIISFTNRKKCSKFVWKSFDCIAKSAKLGRFKKT